jgi:DNA-binding winged helix-turn-helix (wHTH) protein
MKTSGLVRFSDFELDIDRYQLRRAGQEVRLEHKPMELLILLAERGGELVARAEIVRALWGPNSFRDTENGLNTVVRKIRIALDEDPVSRRSGDPVIRRSRSNAGSGVQFPPLNSSRMRSASPLCCD